MGLNKEEDHSSASDFDNTHSDGCNVILVWRIFPSLSVLGKSHMSPVESIVSTNFPNRDISVKMRRFERVCRYMFRVGCNENLQATPRRLFDCIPATRRIVVSFFSIVSIVFMIEMESSPLDIPLLLAERILLARFRL
jgi:hypothetical protein